MQYDDERIERELDGALTRYAATEPRTGLEGRVLANLRAANLREVRRASRWRSAVLTIATACAFAGVLLVVERRAAVAPQTGIPKAENVPRPASESYSETTVFAGARRLAARAHQQPTESKTLGSSRMAIPEESPKLEQFPAPEALSPQEALLVRYVGNDPQDAELMAEVIRLATEQRMAASGIPAVSVTTNSVQTMP